MFSNPVNFFVSEFKFYNQSLNEFLVVDAQSHLNLKKLVKAAKKDEKVLFVNLWLNLSLMEGLKFNPLGPM